MSKFLPNNFNDALCVVLMTMIFMMWMLDAAFKQFTPDDKVMGATIAFFTMIGQYYYRKKSSETG